MSDRIVLTLDSESANSTGEFTPLPEGWYDVVIDEVDSDGTVQSGDWKGEPAYNYKFKVEGGDNDGRTVFHRVIISGKSGGKAGSIPINWSTGQKTIERVLGNWEKGQESLSISTPDELVGKNLKIKVGIRTYEKDGEEREANEVKSILSTDGKAPASKAKKKSGGFSL